MSATALLDLGLAPLARAIAGDEVRSVDATRACLKALATRGCELRAVTQLWPERAFVEAETFDRERAHGRLRGPLHGVPMAHQDMSYRAGEPAALGSAAYAGFRPQVTASVLERLDSAGAIDIGRLAGAAVVRRVASDVREINALRQWVMMAEGAATHGPRLAGSDKNLQTLARLLAGFALPATVYR